MDGRKAPADEGVRQVPAQGPSLAGNGNAPGELVTFLFADIRGFTAYTSRNGAEAAARLAQSFVSLVAVVVDTHSGLVRGTWGDQVLAEFASPREAVRAAVELQAACITRTLEDPRNRLPVGVGLDIGEPADEGPNRSAAALNVAARLCARAGAGEVLSTPELVHLAGRIEGLSYVDKGPSRLKGVTRPTRVVLVRDDRFDSEQIRRFRHEMRLDDRRDRRSTPSWVAGIAVLSMLLAGVGTVLLRRGPDAPIHVPAGGVAVIDPRAAELVDAVDVGGTPDQLTTAAGDLWVTRAGGGSLAHIDTGTRQVSQVGTAGSPLAVAVTGADVWTVNGEDRFVRRFSTSVDRELDRIEVGNQPVAVAVRAGSVWVVLKADGKLVRLDRRNGEFLGSVNVGRSPRAVAVGHGVIWVANWRDGTVQPVDPRTMQAGAPIAVGAGPSALAVVGDDVWVVNSLEKSVSHIDGRRLVPIDTVPVGDVPLGVVGAAGSVWVSVSASGAVVQINPRSNEVIGTVQLGASPRGLAAASGRLWAATARFAAASHIGGTLTVALSPGDGTDGGDPLTDPALGTPAPTLLPMLYDGLVTWRKADGADGYDLVPDLAESVPRATDGGQTYTFTLRHGVRYSDGRPVRPADFRRGITRAFTAAAEAKSSSPDLYFGILGAQECWDRLKRGKRDQHCDLSTGITTGAHSVTFHLRAPDPDFVYKLALSLASPAPPGSPTGPVSGLSGYERLPGTGPYMVASFEPESSLLLVRNPHFRPWSTAARPPAYPDRIRLVALDPVAGVRAALAGRVDVGPLGDVPDQRLRDLELNHPALVHRTPFAFTWFLQLNTHEAPFEDRSARRALAFAVDRRQFRSAYQTGGQPACQLLPPNFPGHVSTCRYTINPDRSGSWHGPDLARARRLVARSGTGGDRVDIWWLATVAEEGRYLARTLRQLGYDARLHLEEGDRFWPGVFDPETHKDVAANGWIGDYPAAGNFYEPLLSCAHGTGQYCNPSLDRVAASAQAVLETDPGLADRRWRQVYQALDEDAAAVPLINADQLWLVSERVGNYRSSPLLGPLFDQMWVR